MRNYDPVDRKSTPWARLEKIVRDAGKGGISLYALADKLGMKYDSREFTVGLEALKKRKSTEISLGMCPYHKKICLLVYHKGTKVDELTGRRKAELDDEES